MKLIIAEMQAQIAALQRAVHGHVRERWSKRKLAEKEGVTPREVMRRVARGIYSQPEIENGRVYFWSDTYRRVPSTADTPAMRAARNPQLRPRKPTPTSPGT
jgi:hypothetical protein